MDEPIESHPNCRCFTTPIIPGFDAPESTSGEGWLQKQSEQTQRSILGDARYQLWKDGTPLSEMVKITQDKTWGPTIGIKKLGEMAGGGRNLSVSSSFSPGSQNNQLNLTVNSLQNSLLPSNPTMGELEKQIYKQNFETAAVYDPNGNLLFRKDGTKTSVSFTNAEIKQMDGNILTHNHPRGWKYPTTNPLHAGNGFSKADLTTAAVANLQEINAITPTRYYTMQPAPNGWPSKNAMSRAFNKAEKEVRIEMSQLISDPNTTDNDKKMFLANYFHKISEKIANKFNLPYTYVEHGY